MSLTARPECSSVSGLTRVVDSGRLGVNHVFRWQVLPDAVSHTGCNMAKWLKSQRRPVLYTILTGLT
jgi:hypothetical protein